MDAFLYVQLTASAALPAFGHPLVDWVKKNMAAVTALDIDLQSDELMQHYALRLLRESGKSIVCLKAEEGVPIEKLMPLLEELLQPNPNRLVLLLGRHQRLQRIFEARPLVQFKVAGEEELLKEEVSAFFQE